MINLDGTNAKTVLASRTGHTITFDDSTAAPQLVIADRAGSSITWNPTDGSITIAATGTLTLSAAAGTTTLTMTASGVDVT